MRCKFLAPLLTILILSCHTGNRNKPLLPTGNKTIQQQEKHRVAMLPFKGTDSNLVRELEAGIKKQLPVDVLILDDNVAPGFAFYKPRQRYIADSLLVFLRQVNANRFEKIIGITTKDISTRKGDIENWGILGLGSCPGEACVISSFRAGRNKVSYPVFLRRMITLALHELGHTYGLEHCAVATCLMKDAEGKMNLDDGDTYCSNCQKWLREKGILK